MIFSAVCAVFNVTLDNGKVEAISSGFGGVAAVPSNLQCVRKTFLKGKQFASNECFNVGQNKSYSMHFSPIDDVRATAQYRKNCF